MHYYLAPVNLYYGLRSYDLDPMVFDEDPNCNHVWGEKVGCPTKIGKQGSTETRKHKTLVESMGKPKAGQFCIKCNAYLGCLGNENTPELYIDHLVQIFAAAKRVMRDDSVLFIVVGDSYWGGKGQSGTKGSKHQEKRHDKGESLNRGYQTLGGSKLTKPTDSTHDIIKPKDLVGIPHMLALALRADGWYWRSMIIWDKSNNCMPESVRDRPTTSHEYIIMLAKSKHYFYDQDAVREPSTDQGKINVKPLQSGKHNEYIEQMGLSATSKLRQTRVGCPNSNGRNRRSVFRVNTKPYNGAHFAVMPVELTRIMLLAGSSDKACPDCGTAWVRVKAKTGEFQRRWGKGNKVGSPYNKQDSMQNTYVELGRKPNCDCYDDLYKQFPKAKSPRKRIQHDLSGNWWKRVKKRPGDEDTWPTKPSVVLDPMCGSGTTCQVAIEEGRSYIVIEPNPEYVELINKRIEEATALKQLKDSQPNLFDF